MNLLDSTHNNVPRVRFVGKNAIEYAAGAATNRASAVEPTATTMLFHAWPR